MPKAHEQRWAGLLFGYIVFAALLGAATVPVYMYLAPDSKPLIIRLAVGCLAGTILLRLARAARTASDSERASAFEQASPSRRVPARPNPTFEELRANLRVGMASANYFDEYLWPHFNRIAGRDGAGLRLGRLVRPPDRRLRRRGPSFRSLARIVEILERTP